MKLSDCITCISGPNLKEQKRLIDEEHYSLYTSENLAEDLSKGYKGRPEPKATKYLLSAGDLIINLMTNTSTIVALDNDGKLMSQRIMKLVPNGQIDPWFLCFLLNESIDVKKQEYKKMEGTVIRRVTARLIKNLEIDLPSLEKQKQIGQSYRALEKKIKDNQDFIKQLQLSTITMLNNYLKEV